MGSQTQEALVPVCMSADDTESRFAENFAALRNLRREISSLEGATAVNESVSELSGVHAQRLTSFGHVSSDVEVRQHAINGAGSQRDEQILL